MSEEYQKWYTCSGGGVIVQSIQTSSSDGTRVSLVVDDGVGHKVFAQLVSDPMRLTSSTR